MAQYDVTSGVTSTGIILKNDSMYVSMGGTADNATLSYGGSMHVSSGGTATNATVNAGGSMYVSSGGTADNTTVNKEGLLGVSAGGTANNTTVNSDGLLTVSSGGTANSTTVNAGGSMYVYSGGTATNTTVNEWGAFHVLSGGMATNTTVNRLGELRVSSGGTATEIMAADGAYLNFTVAPDTYIQGASAGSAFEIKDGATTDYKVNFGNELYVRSGGVATNTTVNANGRFYVSSGGVADNTTVNIVGNLYVYSGGKANSTTVNSGGSMFVSSGGTANSTTVNSGGRLHVSSGGVADNTTVNEWGLFEGSSGGVIRGTVVNSGGSLLLYNGAKLTGRMTFETGAEVIPFVGSILDFDLTQTKPGVNVLVNDLSVLMGTPAYTITVSDTQAKGTYKLARGASAFSKSITVVNTSGTELGSLELGKTIETKSGKYSLKLKSGTLSVTVSSSSHGGTPILPIPELDDGENNVLYDKKNDNWNDAKISVSKTITGNGEINLDAAGSVNTEDGYHNIFGNDGTKTDTGDVAKISVGTTAKLTFTIDSTAAGTFYVYEKVDKGNGKYKQVTVGKVAVKAGKTAKLENVCLTAGEGKYYAAMVAKSVQKIGTEGRYNVSVTESKFFVDADKSGNNEASDSSMVLIGRGAESKPILLDWDPMTGSTEFKNFVGFTDGKDYARLDLASSAYLKFKVTGDGDGKAKFTLWKQAKGTTGKAPSKVTGVSLPEKKKYEATTKAQFLDADKYTYYISMECTDEAKGKGVYYNVQVTDDAVFFDSADNDLINGSVYDKKKNLNPMLSEFRTNDITASVKEQEIFLDGSGIKQDGYRNFVGYNDKADYARFSMTATGDVTFKISTTGAGTFAIYRNNEAKKKLEVIRKVEIKTNANSGELSVSGLAAGDYFISMTAKNTKANDKGSVFYNVTANATLSENNSDALAMPEISDSLATTDSLSFASFDADALASASASALAGLDGKSAWQSMLA